MSETAGTFSAGRADDLLARPLQFVKGAGPVRAGLLLRLNLQTLQDVLFYFPAGHKDRASVTPVAQIKADREVNIVAQILDVRGRRFGGKEKVEALLADATGQIRASWWNPYVANKLTPNAWGFFSGKTSLFNERRELGNAEFEIVSDDEPAGASGRGMPTGPSFGRIVPVYNLRPKQRLPSGEEAPVIRITQNFLRKLIWQTLGTGAAERIQDQIPEALRKKLRLPGLAAALRQIHFPDSFEALAQARRRLVFEELFIVSLGVALRRAEIAQKEAPHRLPLTPAIRARIQARLPFTLTPAQAQAFGEIAADLAGPHPMNRLLQGDVGSGKTAVAVSALLLCVAHGGQAALLAPTEVLAEQHARTLARMLANSRVKIGLLRSGTAVLHECGQPPGKEARPLPPAACSRDEFLAQLSAGGIHIAIGTHALLEPDVRFKALWMAVVDEQHKFGVLQRQALRGKGRAPHVLVMTATPIPRTLTLTLYGDLDVSVISASPPGRGEIVTRLVSEADRERVCRLIVSEAKLGHASYVVLPRIEGDASAVSGAPAAQEKTGLFEGGEAPASGSKKIKARRSPQRLWSEVKGVEEEVVRLRERLPALRIGMLHGRMAGDEKDAVLEKLRLGELDVLVSTQVIEVGIDLPNATVMAIENAEMFGLSALHQLRGRVGRSELKSYCLVFGSPASDEARERLKTFVGTRDGFEIAEADFRLRGPGQFFGTQQSGMPELKIADLLRDTQELQLARAEAFELVKSDPKLALPGHAGLRQRVSEVLGPERLRRVDVG